jgi:hypothetical protein
LVLLSRESTLFFEISKSFDFCKKKRPKKAVFFYIIEYKGFIP